MILKYDIQYSDGTYEGYEFETDGREYFISLGDDKLCDIAKRDYEAYVEHWGQDDDYIQGLAEKYNIKDSSDFDITVNPDAVQNAELYLSDLENAGFDGPVFDEIIEDMTEYYRSDAEEAFDEDVRKGKIDLSDDDYYDVDYHTFISNL